MQNKIYGNNGMPASRISDELNSWINLLWCLHFRLKKKQVFWNIHITLNDNGMGYILYTVDGFK